MFYVKIIDNNGSEEFFEADYITYIPARKIDNPTEASSRPKIIIERNEVDKSYCEVEVFVMNNTGQTIERYVV